MNKFGSKLTKSCQRTAIVLLNESKFLIENSVSVRTSDRFVRYGADFLANSNSDRLIDKTKFYLHFTTNKFTVFKSTNELNLELIFIGVSFY